MPMTEFAISDGHALADEQPAGDEFATLALSAIVPSLTNPRTHFDEAKLAELAESIKAQGVGQPILVRPLPAKRLDETSRKLGRGQRETHEIISGERRLAAQGEFVMVAVDEESRPTPLDVSDIARSKFIQDLKDSIVPIARDRV